jgi:hypothetical protein
MLRAATGLSVALALLGCNRAVSTPDEGLKSGRGHGSFSLTSGGAIAQPSTADRNAARKAPQVVIVLDVYHLLLPAGAVSNSDEFWKRIDEDAIDVATHDLLLKNGIRIGLGHDNDWPYFKGLLGKHPSSKQSRLRSEPGKEGYLELGMRTTIPEQSIFGIDDQGVDWGRRFEKCDDLLGISFIASTHNPGEAVVKVCPIVRGLRQTYSVSILNNEETQIEQNHSEHLYDMRCEAVIPVNTFLIVSPSKQASQLATSLGATFLTSEGKAEPLEHVLVLVPRAFRTNETPPPADILN